ncbi:carboxypeptidase regulatory-like domain-containing protein [Occallatibacter riparius]|uniref:Carboxypeptidase regulatory-like domain-containing protein n=1 Tax=Occallatibacter riparius TaxID=1002689 RepID=A0A9J7BM75_9BACT|nr:carboxypeptidase regulatory-like domain-containing protein [Occallatibacter riparius]UWZ83840.1 carboxypeptidase regulatory-like domain-containing protein [Occallatibacter riparius]
MTERFQTGVHPDADQISLFLEGAATAQERAQMLEHLAGCAACREMVFLAQGVADPEPVAVPEDRRVTAWWRRGWMPFGLAGAVLAFGLALMIYVRQPGAPVGDGQMARVEAPATGPANAPSPEGMQKAQPTIEADQASKGAEGIKARKAASGGGRGSGGGLGVGVPEAAPEAPPTVTANEQALDAARGNMVRFQQNAVAAPAAPPPPAMAAPAPAAAAVADAGAQQQQAIAANKPAQGGPSAQQQYPVAGATLTGRNLAALEVLHDQTLGEVSGVVKDASGAVIGGASVSLNGGADKAVREVATGLDGRFRITDVPAGKYELRVSARGFNTRVESVELTGSQVAKLEPVLTVGAASQTVTVETNNAPLDTAEVSVASLLQEEKLPGGAAAAARVSVGGRMLSMDGAGRLYLSRDSGKTWKKVKPKWAGKAERLAVVPAGGGQVFEMTTDAGTVWTSQDGKHWRVRADGKR